MPILKQFLTIGNNFFFNINFTKSLHLPQEYSAHRGGSRTLKITLKTHNTQHADRE
jgi:hypothetical protein